MHGHMKAKLDPLGLAQRRVPRELDPAFYGFSESDWEREFYVGVWRNFDGFLSENRPVQTLREIVARLERVYCGSIGFEYMHVGDEEKVKWIRERIETQECCEEMDQHHRVVILERLAWSLMFEEFLGTKWTSAKRFFLFSFCSTIYLF